MIKKFVCFFCFIYLSLIQMKASGLLLQDRGTNNIFNNEKIKARLTYKKGFKGHLEQYGDPLFFAAPISLWLTSRYLSSRNIKPNLMEKIKKASFIGMEAHLLYRVGKECYSFYQTVSNGENPLDHFSLGLKNNFITRLFTQAFYFSKSLLESEAFLNLSLIFFEAQKNRSQDININIDINKFEKEPRKNKDEEKKLEEKKKDKKENPFALLGLLAVPVIVTAGLLWASVYKQPFFKECKELEKLLKKNEYEKAKVKVLEYYQKIENENTYLKGDPREQVKEDLEKSLEVLIYNKKLIEQKSEVMKLLFVNMHEKNPYELRENFTPVNKFLEN